ncbi:hypothetical protein NC652_013307 [Populus alba x Populus x berolinensis]|uniref:Uncharacterized protein n=1 Tax=Populus alba x Populus x berolinensis TaxID=444605 RepID=A0AAD6W2A9_9ROSI|nr:hypothetical protein NC652_013307 [Populus alba x Populus x berolinensis]KAJ6996618.1 hypothetical protein NC653_013276 [Populus alba x Populus x berolinensis]
MIYFCMPGILLHTVGNSEDKLSKCFKLARNEVGAMLVNIFARVRLCLCYQYKTQIIYSSNLLSVASILAVLKKEAGYY